MSQNSNLIEDEFKVVSYKRKNNWKNIQKTSNCNSCEEFEVFDETKAHRRIKIAREDLEYSDLLSSTLASIREALQHLDHPTIAEIICIGLGNAYERLISRYQLTLLLILREKYHLDIIVTDPRFNESDFKLFELLNVKTYKPNIEGKFVAAKDKATIFFLPHCPKHLTNNLLYANWSLNLKNCIVIANSLTKIVEETSKLALVKNGGYILRLWDYTLELPIINTFKYFDVFNDLAVHIFPEKKLKLIPEDFWANRKKPNYDPDVEFITNEFVNIEL